MDIKTHLIGFNKDNPRSISTSIKLIEVVDGKNDGT